MSTMVPKASLNKNKYLQGIQHIEEVIFALNEFNIEMSIESLLESFDENFFYSFNLSISRLLYKFFKSQMKDISICIQFIKVLNQKEDDMKSNYKIIDIFLHFLLHLKTNESNYFIEMMTEANIIPSNIAKNRSTLFFAHYKTTDEIFGLRPESPLGKYFYDNYEELSKNDWELHKEYVKEGHNPNEFAKIIRNDEVDKLQEITSQINFDFNQTIEPSLYEICSFINKENVSLIDYAAFFGSVKCFKYLLMKNSDLTNTGKYAVAGGNLEIFHLCEQKQISFEGSYEIAIEFHRDEIFQYLYNKKISRIKKFADLGVCSIKHDNNLFISFLESKKMKTDKNIINLSAKIGNIFLVKHFLKNDIPSDILVYASKSGNIELVKYLLEEKHVDVNSTNMTQQTALMKAAKRGNVEVFKYLLQQEEINIYDKDRFGTTAFMFAAEGGNIEIVKIFIDQYKFNINDVNIDKLNALMFASKKGNTEIVELLLKQDGIKINEQDNLGNTALLLVPYSNGTKIIKLLLEQDGIEVNIKDKYGDTILLNAAKYGLTELTKLLLHKEGIGINDTDKYGWTPLMQASYCNHKEVVKLLLEHEGIDINAKDQDGKTAFMKVAVNGNIDIMKLFLTKKNLDINARDNNGKTVLIVATEYSQLGIIKLLLEQEGVDINAKDYYDNTALKVATQKGNFEIVDLITKKLSLIDQ